MAAPAFVNAGTLSTQGNGQTITVNLPASRVNGNLLLAFVMTSNNNKTYTWPAGWTVMDALSSAANCSAQWAYRIVDGSETAPAVTWTTNAAGEAQMYQYSGVVSSSPIGAHHATISASGTAAADSGVTVQRNNSLVAVIMTGSNGTATTVSSQPSGYTNDVAWSDPGAGNGGYGEWSQTTPSAIGNASTAVAITMSAARRWMVFSIEIASQLAGFKHSSAVFMGG